MNLQSFSRKAVLLSAFAATIGILPAAHADEIGVAGLKPIKVTFDKIVALKDPDSGELKQVLSYKTLAGSPGSREITDKLRIALDDEPNLNAGEEAFFTEKWADAVDAYQKTLRATNKPWLKDYAASRLLKSAEKSNRIDSAVAAYLYMLNKNAATAVTMKPRLPDDSANAYLKSAAKLVDDALTTERDQGKILTLKAFRMDVARAMKDDATATKLAGELAKVGAAGGTPTPGADSATLEAVIDGKLDLIRSAIDKKDFAAARKSLDDSKESIVEPKHQAEWLYLSAEDQAGLTADSKDPKALQDLAIEYMRVVAHFPSNPRASQSLLKTAVLMEKLNDPKTALALYQQIARDYEGQPIGAEAQKGAKRLDTAGGTK